MTFCWNLSGNYYAGISSTYVLTFVATENTKKETCEPQPVMLWWETHLSTFQFVNSNAATGSDPMTKKIRGWL